MHEAQALVDFEPHKGAVVVGITLLESLDNYAIRSALEPQALRLSLPHLTEADFEIALNPTLEDALNSADSRSNLETKINFG